MKNSMEKRNNRLSNRIGLKNVMKNGQVATITEYNNANNIVICFEDGTSIKTRYCHFMEGSVINPNDPNSNRGDKIVGESLVMNNGLKATIIACRNHDDIDVQFEDGIIVEHRDYGGFKKHQIGHPTIKTKRIIDNQGRLGESHLMNNGQHATIIEYRKYDDIDVEFEDGTVLFNRSYHDFKTGNMKNKKCPTKRPVNKEKYIGNTNVMSNGQTATIVEYRNYRDIDVEFEDGYVAKHKLLASFVSGFVINPNLKYKKKVLKDRTGEENIMNNGQKAVIIRYGTSADIDVKFEDGYVKYNTEYNRFKEGSIANPNDVSKGSSLQEFAIIYYLRKHGFYKLEERINGKRFELDVLNPKIGGIEYDGKAWHSKKANKDNAKSEYFYNRFGFKLIHIREKGLQKLDEKYSKVYELSNDKPLSLEYEELLNNLFINEFNIKTKVNFTKDRKKICEEYYMYCHHINEVRTMNNGQTAKLIAYRGSEDIDIQFEDGTVVEHRQYSGFKRGTVSNPSIIKKRLGKTKLMNNGQAATIIRYGSYTDIDVKFEDGEIAKNVTYQRFNEGSILNPSVIRSREPKSRIGECKMMNNGQYATIIKYRKHDDIDVQFEDKYVARNKKYRSFQKGQIVNPSVPLKRKIDDKGRIGETLIMNCGEKATIIDYRKWDDIDVKFEDGTIVKHRQYSGFKEGRIAKPKITK